MQTKSRTEPCFGGRVVTKISLFATMSVRDVNIFSSLMKTRACFEVSGRIRRKASLCDYTSGIQYQGIPRSLDGNGKGVKESQHLLNCYLVRPSDSEHFRDSQLDKLPWQPNVSDILHNKS